MEMELYFAIEDAADTFDHAVWFILFLTTPDDVLQF